MDIQPYKGKEYHRTGKKWVDNSGFVVNEILQDILNHEFFKTHINDIINKLTLEELIIEGDNCKETGSSGLAEKCYRIVYETNSVYHVKSVLPKLTSLYRKMGKPNDAIAIYGDAKSRFGNSIINHVTLTSVAAAYCDVKEYVLAKKACDRALAMLGGKATGELSAVYARLRKEAPELFD